jgi:hypothetical protein
MKLDRSDAYKEIPLNFNPSQGSPLEMLLQIEAVFESDAAGAQKAGYVAKLVTL